MPEPFIRRDEYEARESITRESLTRLEGKIDGINNKLDQSSEDKLKTITNFVTTFFAGGGLLAIIEWALTRR